jgi:hypothetical protein
LRSIVAQTFVILEGALAFFTFSDDGVQVNCTIISAGGAGGSPRRALRQRKARRRKDEGAETAKVVESKENRVLIVEKGQYHGMAAAPVELGWPGYAIVFETSGHVLDIARNNKVLAPFAPVNADPSNGEPDYYTRKLYPLCPTNS